MKNHRWTQDALFPEKASATVRVQLHLNEEAQILGASGTIHVGSRQMSESEFVSWNNYNANGLVQALEHLVDLIRDTEEHHGLDTGDIEFTRDAAPF